MLGVEYLKTYQLPAAQESLEQAASVQVEVEALALEEIFLELHR